MKIKTLLKLSTAEGIADKIFSFGKQENMYPLTVVILDTVCLLYTSDAADE